MLSVQQVAIICDFTEMLGLFKDYANKQRKLIHRANRWYLLVIPMCAALTLCLYYIVRLITPRDYAEVTITQYVYEIVITFILLLACSWFLISMTTSLPGWLVGDALDSADIRVYGPVVEKLSQPDASSEAIFAFLDSTGVMPELVVNWRAISALKHHDCSVYVNPDAARVLVYDTVDGALYEVTLDNVVLRSDTLKDDITLMLYPKSAHINADIDTATVRQFTTDEDFTQG